MEYDADIVDVGVEVIEKLPIIDGRQFVTCTEEIFADIVDKCSFFHPNIYYIWLVTCKSYILRRLVKLNQSSERTEIKLLPASDNSRIVATEFEILQQSCHFRSVRVGKPEHLEDQVDIRFSEPVLGIHGVIIT